MQGVAPPGHYSQGRLSNRATHKNRCCARRPPVPRRRHPCGGVQMGRPFSYAPADIRSRYQPDL